MKKYLGIKHKSVMGLSAIVLAISTLSACGGGGGGVEGGGGTPQIINVMEGTELRRSLPSSDSNGNTLTYQVRGAAPAGFSLDATGAYVFDARNAAYTVLNQGQVVQVQVFYTVTTSRGSFEDRSLTFEVSGVSLVVGTPNPTVTVTRGNVASGSLATTSAAGRPLVYNVEGAEIAGFNLSPSGAYTLDTTDAAYANIATGQTRTVVASYSVTDGTETSVGTVTFTVQGRNAINAVTLSLEATEGQRLTGVLPSRSADGRPLTYSVRAAVAGFTVTDAGGYSFDSNNEVYKPLNDGQRQNVEIFLTVSDGQTTADGSIRVTVLGRTDIRTGLNQTIAVNEGSVFNGALPTRSELGQTLSYAITDGTVVPGFTLSSAGVFRLDGNAPGFADLAAGQRQRFTAFYVVSDSTGARANGQINFDVTGIDAVSSAPVNIQILEGTQVIQALPTRSTANRPLSYNVRSTAPDGFSITNDGILTMDARVAAYRELNDGQTRTVTAFLSVSDGASVTNRDIVISVQGKTNIETGVLTRLSVAEGGTINGELPRRSPAGNDLTYTLLAGNQVPGLSFTANGIYSFNAGDQAFRALNNGQTSVQRAIYRVNDLVGNSAEGVIEFTVLGRTNIVSTTPNVVMLNEGASVGPTQLQAVSGLNSQLTFSLQDAAPAGFTLTSDGRYTFNTNSAVYTALQTGQSLTVVVPYTVSDSTGAFVNDSITFQVNGISPVAPGAPATITLNEGATFVGNLRQTGQPPSTFTATGTVPDGVTLMADGTIMVNAQTGFSSLREAQTRTQTLAYRVQTSAGDIFNFTVDIVVVGVNTQPAANDYQDSFTAKGGTRPGTLQFQATDPEGEALTYQIDPDIPVNSLPPGFILASNGTYTLNTNDAAYNDPNRLGEYRLVYIVRDPGGLTARARLTITVLPELSPTAP